MAAASVSPSEDPLDFTTDFPRCLWEQRKVSNDLTLRVGPYCGPVEDFKANSDVIMARCKYMRTAVPVKDSLTEQHPLVEIPDMTPDQFRPYFKYIYKDNMDCFKTTIDELVNGLYAGKRFVTPPLVTKCREKLEELIRQNPVENGLKFLTRTEDFIHEDEEIHLIKCAELIFDENMNEVLKCESLKSVNYETMKRVIGNKNSDAEPLQRLVALNNWVEERLRNTNVEINQKSKFDLCSEVLFTIPVQDIPAAELHKKVRAMELLPDQLFMDITSYHYDHSVNLPFHFSNTFTFQSKVTEEFHEHCEAEFREKTEIKLEIDLNDYKSDEHEVGYKVTSEDIYNEREPGTKWNVDYYPCGYDVRRKHGIGVYLTSKSIDEVNKGQVHAHCTFQIIVENEQLARKEVSHVYSSIDSIGTASLISRSSLPDKFTLRACIQWSPVPQIFYQPSTPRSIDGKKVSTVVARWNIQGYTAGRQNYWLNSPVFGQDGFLWNIRTDFPDVQLMKLPENRETITAKVSFTFGNNSSSEEQSEEKEYKYLTVSKEFTLPEEHRNNPEITVKIDYQL